MKRSEGEETGEESTCSAERGENTVARTSNKGSEGMGGGGLVVIYWVWTACIQNDSNTQYLHNCNICGVG